MKNMIITSIIIFSAQFIFISCGKEATVSAPPAPAPLGKLIIDSSPQGAEIFLNGLNTNKVTPDSIIHLEAGSYDIKVRLYPFADLTETILVDSVEPSNVFKDFTAAEENYCQIEVISDPEGAEIFLNGDSTGLLTPDTIKSLWFDTYSISCRYPEHRSQSEDISLTGGQFKSLNFALQDTSLYVDFNPSNSEFPSFHVSCVAVDDNNIVWAGCSPGMIIKYERGEFSYYNSRNAPFIADYINCIEIDDNNTKWFGTNRGLISYDEGGNWNFYNTSNSDIPADEVTALTFDQYSNVWLGAGNPITDKYLAMFDGTGWTYWEVPRDRSVQSLAVDQDGLIWVGLELSLYMFYMGNWITPPLDREETPNLIHRGVESITIHENGRVLLGAASRWYRSDPGGLHSAYEGVFSRYTFGHFHEQHISDVYIAPNRNEWISTLGKYPFIVPDDQTTILIKRTPDRELTYYNKENCGLSSGYIFEAAAQSNGDLWLATRDKGIIKFKQVNNY